MVRWWWLLLGGCVCAWAQNAATVRAAANLFAAQNSSPALTEEQRNEAAKLRHQAEQDSQAGRYGEALRNYAHATAVVRHARWTPGAELAASVELRVEHVMLEPGQPVTLSLARLYPVAPSEGAKLTASVFLAPATTQAQATRELMPPAAIEPGRIPFSAQVQVPEMTLGNYDLAVHLTPASAGVPEMLEDVFTKIVPVHIERLAGEVGALRSRLAKASAKNAAERFPSGAWATVEYALRFYERADRGEEGLRRFGRYSFPEEFTRANAILDDLEEGRDPFAGRSGDFHRAYRSAVDQTLQPYRLFVPGAYDGATPAPLVIALHGSGGDESDFFDGYGDLPLKPEAERLGFLVVCPKGRGPNSGYRGAAERDVFDALAEVRREYRIDVRRIYLMGHSMGAFATWRLAAERPELFAALGLISGGGDPGEANKIRDIPQYVVHGELDPVVPVARSRTMVEALRKAGATVVYVELPGAGHYETVAAQLRPMLDFFAGHARPAPR
jgi:predicted esterase